MLFPTTLITDDLAIIQGLVNGSLKRFGGVIRETGTGRIVRHLAETPGWTQQLINLPVAPIAGGPSLITNMVGHTVTISKVGEVQKTLQVTNQMLSQVMGLSQIAAGASVLGLGVSIAGFAYMGYKLHQLQKSMDKVQQTMEAGFGRIDGKLDHISGQLSYLQLLVEDNRKEQAQLADAINDLHKALLVKEVAGLQAAIQNRERFPDSLINEDLKKATEAKIFLSNQAFGASPELDSRKIMVADIAIQGWVIATATEAYILLETGHILEANQILNSELIRLKELASQWIEVLLKSERPGLATAYRFTDSRFQNYITDERVDRIAALSLLDAHLNADHKRRRVDDVEVEFDMSYNSEFDTLWLHRQIAEADFMDALSELIFRIESLEAFASLCEASGVETSKELLPEKSCEPGLYLINPEQESQLL